jgi:hypothetical protein
MFKPSKSIQEVLFDLILGFDKHVRNTTVITKSEVDSQWGGNSVAKAPVQTVLHLNATYLCHGAIFQNYLLSFPLKCCL